MSREIKFRGKSLFTSKWVIGSYIKTDFCDSGAVIANGNGFGHVEVDPETVGQYTGLKDKNGVEIYEGDVIGFGADSPTCNSGMYGELGVVFMCNYRGQWMVKLNMSNREVQLADHLLFSDRHTCRVNYGNIHENPELINQ